MLKALGHLALVLVIVAAILPTVQAEASPPQDYTANFPAVALGIAAGQAVWQVGYPTSMPVGAGTYHVIVDVSTNVAPAAGVALALATAGFAFSSPGCTVGVFVQDAVALNSVAGYVPITVAAGTKYCYGTGRFTLTLAPPVNVVISQYRVNWEFEVEQTENSNYDFLCDAPGTTLLAYNSGTTVCNDANLAITGSLTATLAGTLALTGIPDTQQEIQAIADALSAGLDVTICPESAPCFQVLSGDVGFNGTFTQNGNNTFPSTITVESATGDFFGPILLWIVGIWASMRLSKLMAAGACTIGLGFSLVAPGNFPLQILALAILGVVLWLEAFAREQIYARFFRYSKDTSSQE